jgi:predicted RNA-binding protein with PUA domain
MNRRYCEMCDRMVKGRECPLCGADTRSLKTARPWPQRAMESPRSGDAVDPHAADPGQPTTRV